MKKIGLNDEQIMNNCLNIEIPSRPTQYFLVINPKGEKEKVLFYLSVGDEDMVWYPIKYSYDTIKVIGEYNIYSNNLILYKDELNKIRKKKIEKITDKMNVKHK